MIRTVKISEERGIYHMCEVTGFMTPFIPIGGKDKKLKNMGKNVRRENVPMVSYGYSDSEDPMMGAPTRGRG